VIRAGRRSGHPTTADIGRVGHTQGISGCQNMNNDVLAAPREIEGLGLMARTCSEGCGE
jgi:hypothetical protein